MRADRIAEVPTLYAENVSVSFGGVDVVKGVDLELQGGEVHALTGENGAGKTTLGRAIAGVVKLRTGSLNLDGKTVRFKNPREALEAGIALIHQEPQTFLDLSVAENIFAGNFPRNSIFARGAMCRDEANVLLRKLGCNLRAEMPMTAASIAQRQYVELAGALAHSAKIWIFDETTAPLSPKETQELFETIRGLKANGAAIMVVTHRMNEVFAVSDRITVLRDGCKVGEYLTKETNADNIVRAMVGRELQYETFDRNPAPKGEPILMVDQLTGRRFSNVDLSVYRGEIFGLAGLVGAGRTEFVQSLFGISPPKSGRIEYEGRVVQIGSPEKAERLGIALVPEDRILDGLFNFQSVEFNSTISNLAELSSGHLLNQRKLNGCAQEFATRTQLVFKSMDQPVQELSGGNQQKVVLSKWLCTNPKLLIVDEPTRGVDVGAKHEIHKILRQLASSGVAILMVSSELNELLAVADRIGVMRSGKLVATLPWTEASEESIMHLATTGGGQ